MDQRPIPGLISHGQDDWPSLGQVPTSDQSAMARGGAHKFTTEPMGKRRL